LISILLVRIRLIRREMPPRNANEEENRLEEISMPASSLPHALLFLSERSHSAIVKHMAPTR
jgi:hypothetical protein